MCYNHSKEKYLYLNEDRGLRMRFPVYEDLR